MKTTQHWNHYPFMIPYSFYNDEFQPHKIRDVIKQFLRQHFMKMVEKNGESAIVPTLIDSLSEGCFHQHFFGSSEMTAAVEKTLREGEECGCNIPFTNIWVRMKRFGEGISFRAAGKDGEPHVNATEIFRGMLDPSKGRPLILPFYHGWSVINERLAEENPYTLIIGHELTWLERYAPDIIYHQDCEHLATRLRERYLQIEHDAVVGPGGVEIGACYGMPIRAHILFGGNDRSNRVWRQGAVTQNGGVLIFDSNTGNERPKLCYSVWSADKNNLFKPSRRDIDYEKEQDLMKHIITSIGNAIESADMALSIKRDPRIAEWCIRSPQPTSA